MARDEAYYEAEKKIEEARQSGLTKLDLRNLQYKDPKPLQLTELPESLGRLTQLQSLDLSDNQLTALPEWLEKLTLLWSLNLSSNLLTVLPEWLGKLTQLQTLDITDNRITALPELLGELNELQTLNVNRNQLTALPESLGELKELQTLSINHNQLTILPKWVGNLTKLQKLNFGNNQLTTLPESMINLNSLNKLFLYGNKLSDIPLWIENLYSLEVFEISDNQITNLPKQLCKIQNLEDLRLGYKSVGKGNPLKAIPAYISELKQLQSLHILGCEITDIPSSLAQLENLKELDLSKNPLNPELAAAYEKGLDSVKTYLRAKAESQLILNEAKLILVGEGGVGKTSLLSALRGEEWVENRETTHGVEVVIKSLVVNDAESGKEITLNGWDFGGQNIYRHTHQLFFTAPAVYLAVWDPRRGPDVCKVDEWIKMIKHRAYDETRHAERPRILIVATNGGPTERLAHIDEQALRDEFGDLIAGFYHIDSKPDPEMGQCHGLNELTLAIAREAASIPSVGRSVPLSWKNVLEAVRKRSERDPYISYEQFESLCARQKVSHELAALYAVILNELGHLIHYRGDETLKDTVILKPDYLSKAISYVLEDKAARDARGLVQHSHFSEIWQGRYPQLLHPIFIKLMEKFDLTYQVVMPEEGAPPTSLVAQLVPGIRPEGWESDWQRVNAGDVARTQVCRIVDAETGRTVEAEGLIYRLIVRLHRYSLGRKNYYDSRHWKTGLLLDDGYNGRAFIDEVGGDVYITVRAAYPERFLSHLCSEIEWLVDHFWKGLDAKLFVPCPSEKCKGLLEIAEMMDNKSHGLDKVRCSICRNYHEIDSLMATMQPKPIWDDAVKELRSEHRQILQAQEIGFGSLSTQLRILMSQADEQYENLLAWLSDPAKEGPRLFSFEPVNMSRFDPGNWTHETFRLTLWCEHAKVPLPYINGKDSKKGVYEIPLTRGWFRKAAPLLKVITTTASLILPVAFAGVKLTMADDIYKAMEKQLDFSKEVINASLTGIEKSTDWLSQSGDDLPKGMRTDDSALRELHAFLKKEDPGFGGLERVQNKRREFLWVHKQYVNEY